MAAVFEPRHLMQLKIRIKESGVTISSCPVPPLTSAAPLPRVQRAGPILHPPPPHPSEARLFFHPSSTLSSTSRRASFGGLRSFREVRNYKFSDCTGPFAFRGELKDMAARRDFGSFNSSWRKKKLIRAHLWQHSSGVPRGQLTQPTIWLPNITSQTHFRTN